MSEKKPVVLPDSLDASKAMKGNWLALSCICGFRRTAAHQDPKTAATVSS
jgi:hypothetical protein